MNVHLIRSQGFKKEKYEEVLEFLQSFGGPVHFLDETAASQFNPEDLTIETVDKEKFFFQESHICYSLHINPYPPIIPKQRARADWEYLFDECVDYRFSKDMDLNDMVILLTDVANKHNWFSALDPNFRSHGFVHTADWEHYVKCSEVFPVAYLVASLVLQKHMFKDMKALKKAVHQFPLGCINDFCEHKREIILKLRTADVCYDCMNLLKDKLEPIAVQQMLDIFEGVRKRILFNQNFRQNLKPSRLVVTAQGKIFLSDYGNIEVKLTPLEKTLYLFFLNHPEGVMLHDLVDHKEELRNIYARFSTSGLLAEIHSRVDALVDLTSNSINEKISKVKAAFVKAVGKDLAVQYYIRGEHNNKKFIELRRDLYTLAL